MKKYVFIFGINEPVFGTAIIFLLNIPFIDFERRIKILFPDWLHDSIDSPTTEGVCFMHYDKVKNRDVTIIWLKTFKPDSVISIGRLMHEIGHATWCALESRNMLGTERNEPYCYLMEYYIVKALRKINKQLK